MSTKRPSKQSIRKKLQKQAEALWKAYCLNRDNSVCQVAVHFPTIGVRHSNVMQVDHCFSRQNKEIFLDVANGTTLCSTCNAIKGSGKIGASKRDCITIAVHEIVKRREGQCTYDRLFEIAGKRGAFLDWKNIDWLEMQVRILQELKGER